MVDKGMLRVTLLAVLTISFLPRAAEACKCAQTTPELVAPKDGATGVPLNTRILVSAEKAGEVRWAGADTTKPMPVFVLRRSGVITRSEKAIATTVSAMLSEAWGTVYVITPKTALAKNTGYTVWKTVGKGKAATSTEITSFTTGDAKDTTAPVFGGIENFTAVFAHQRRTTCHDHDPPYNQLSWEYGEATDDVAAKDALVRILYVQKKGETRSVKLIEPASVERPITAVTGTTCDPFKPIFQVGDELCATVEVVDLAGNVSGAAIEKCMKAKKI